MAGNNHTLIDALREPARPVFLFGSTPPGENTTEEKAREACRKFAKRSAVLATDGFIVYDIQDEASRATSERPFPFRKTMDPSLYASFFPENSGKQTVLYKCAVEDDEAAFDAWLENTTTKYNHNCFNLVGAASSKDKRAVSLAAAAKCVRKDPSRAFGCVCIPERHTSKGNEDVNMLNKVELGAEWFITQGIFAAEPTIKLLNAYGDACRAKDIAPKKVVLTFAPCGREKTMTFIKWLGMHVPQEIEQRIFAASDPIAECVTLANELLTRILQETSRSGVPLGLNVESLSIFKEEINGAHTLFQSLQATLLNSEGSPWSVRWQYASVLTTRHSFEQQWTDNQRLQAKRSSPSVSSKSAALENGVHVVSPSPPSSSSSVAVSQQQQVDVVERSLPPRDEVLPPAAKQSSSEATLTPPSLPAVVTKEDSSSSTPAFILGSAFGVLIGALLSGAFNTAKRF